MHASAPAVLRQPRRRSQVKHRSVRRVRPTPSQTRLGEMSGEDLRRSSNPFARVFDLDEEPSQGPVVRLAHLIIQQFFLAGGQQFSISGTSAPEAMATLPGMDPPTQRCAVQYLIKDEWKQVMVLPIQAAGPLVNRLKVMSNLDIARHPHQEGELCVRHAGSEYTLSITVTLGPSGTEDVVVRHAASKQALDDGERA